MGWSFWNHGGKTMADCLREEIPKAKAQRIVSDPGREYQGIGYSACEFSDGTTGVVVTLIQYKGGQVGMKHMDESMGPCWHNCPADVLAACTPDDQLPEDGGAWRKEWRQRVHGGQQGLAL